MLNAIAEGGVESVPGLIEALKNEKMAFWALIILRDIGPAAKDAVPAITEKLKDNSPKIRREAVLTLVAMGDEAASAVPEIAKLVSDEHAGTAATFVLGQLGQIPKDAEETVRKTPRVTNCCSAPQVFGPSLGFIRRTRNCGAQFDREASCTAEGEGPVRPRGSRPCVGGLAAGPRNHGTDLGEGPQGCRRDDDASRHGRLGRVRRRGRAAHDRRPEAREIPRGNGLCVGPHGTRGRSRDNGVGQTCREQRLAGRS